MNLPTATPIFRHRPYHPLDTVRVFWVNLMHEILCPAHWFYFADSISDTPRLVVICSNRDFIQKRTKQYQPFPSLWNTIVLNVNSIDGQAVTHLLKSNYHLLEQVIIF